MAATMRTDIGKKRKQNEDAAWFDEKRGVFVVADGMGGHLAGEVASGMAIDAVRKMAARHKKPSIDQIKKTVLGAHERIYQRAQGSAECAGMGTTLSMLCRGAGYIYIAHVGDSRRTARFCAAICAALPASGASTRAGSKPFCASWT